MSWSIFVGRWPEAARSFADLVPGGEPPPIGSRAELASRIQAAVPDADFYGSFEGEILGAGFSVEIDLGKEDPVGTFTLVLGGDWMRAGGAVAAVIEGLGLRGFDEAGEPFDSAAAAAEARRLEAEDPPAPEPPARPYDVAMQVPGTRPGESESVGYVALAPGEDPRRAFRLVTNGVPGQVPSHGAVFGGPCLLTLPDGTRLFGVSYHGDVEGWRARVERGAEELGRVSARNVLEDLVLSDGRRIPLAACGVQPG